MLNPKRRPLATAVLAGGLAVLTAAMVGALTAPTSISADGVVESTSGGFRFPDGTLQITAAVLGWAPVEDTGQQSCWDSTGDPISCTGTGQDGELQAGVDWPAPRFTLNGDGTVTDNLTRLIWLQNADCFGPKSHADALSEVAALNSGSRTCTNYVAGTFSDWRLANVKELLSLVDFSAFHPALPPGHPIANEQGSGYWSSTTRSAAPSSAFMVGMSIPTVTVLAKTNTNLVWPVRDGTGNDPH